MLDFVGGSTSEALTITKIKRSDVAALLDKIEHKKIKWKGEHVGGAVPADATLAALSKLFNWHAARTDASAHRLSGECDGPHRQQNGRDNVYCPIRSCV